MLRDVVSISKALSDANRLRILCALTSGELCVCQLIGLLRLAPSTVSKHLSVLYQARLVEMRKEGRWAYYRLPARDEVPNEVSNATEWVLEALAEDPRIRSDKGRVEKLRTTVPEVLCRLISKKQK